MVLALEGMDISDEIDVAEPFGTQSVPRPAE